MIITWVYRCRGSKNDINRLCRLYRLYARSVCDVQRRCSCSGRLWRYI